MKKPQMLREIANDKITPKKTDHTINNDLYEDGYEIEVWELDENGNSNFVNK